MHGSRLPLTAWSWTACTMATHSKVVSAFRRWRQLGLGSYKTAWLLSVTLRSAMTDPGRIRLAPIADVSAASLYGFINANVAPAATARTDGWQAYPEMPSHCHDPHVIGPHVIGPHVIG